MGHVNSTSNKARALPKGAYIEVGSTGDLGITGGSYTVEAWVKLLAYSKDVADQLDNTILGSDSQETLHIGLRDGRLHMGHYGDDTISTTRQPLGVWRHYAFVYDHVTTEQSIYVNGRRDAVSAGHKPLAGNTPLFIGRHAGGRSLLGEVSELRVWCTAVPEATLGSRVLQRVPDFEGRPHLVACWSQAASRGPRSVKLQPWELKGPVGNETPLPGGDHYAPSFRTYELPAEAGAVGDQTGAGKTGDERKTADTDPDSAVKDSSRVVSGRKGSSAIARASPPAAMLRAADAGKSEEHCGGTAPSRDAAACDGPTKERNDVRAATAMTAGGGTVMVTCERGACVQIGTTAQLGLVGSSYTVETWVKLHEYSGDAGEQRDNAILGSDTCAAHQTLHVVLRCANPHFGHYDADCTAAVPVSLNEWHHVACVYDKLVREMSIYMDGRQVCRERSRPPLEGEVQLTVGRYAGGRAFLGDIARLRVWSKALRADQVADAMTTVHPDFHAACALGLVASMESWLSVRAGDAESNDNTVPWVAVGSASPKRAAGLPDAKESGASHAELLSAVKVATTAEAGAEAFRRLLSVYSRGGSGAVPDKQAVVSAAVALKQRLGGWPPEMAALLNNVLRTLFPGDS